METPKKICISSPKQPATFEPLLPRNSRRKTFPKSREPSSSTRALATSRFRCAATMKHCWWPHWFRDVQNVQCHQIIAKRLCFARWNDGVVSFLLKGKLLTPAPSPTFQLNSQKRGTKQGKVNDINPLSENRCKVQSNEAKNHAASRKWRTQQSKYPQIYISFHHILYTSICLSMSVSQTFQASSSLLNNT